VNIRFIETLLQNRHGGAIVAQIDLEC
jgi:hypothetical protein